MIIANGILNMVNSVMLIFNKLKRLIIFINLLNINNHVFKRHYPSKLPSNLGIKFMYLNIISFFAKTWEILKYSYLLILLSLQQLNLIFSSINPSLGLQQLNPKILALNLHH